MAILIIADLIIGILDIVFLGLLLLVINFYTKNASLTPALLFPLFRDKNPVLLIGSFFLLFSLKNLLGYFLSASQQSFFYGVSSRLSRQNVEQYLKDDYLNFITIDSSVLIRKISQQPIEFSNYILSNLQQVITQGILICCTIIGIFFYHPSLFLLLFLLLLPPVVLLGYFIKRKLRYTRSHTKTTSEKTIQHLQESLSGFIESNIYHKNDFFISRYHRYQKQLNEHIATQQTLQSLPPRLIEVFAVLGFFILIAINSLSAHTPFVDLLTVGVFMAASYKIIPGIVKILNSSGQIKTYEFILRDLLPVNTKNYNTRASSTIASIQFKQINFKYGHHTILNNFNCEISAGDFIGISGKSGLGKTTLIHLILGFLEQGSGNILINNKVTAALERQAYWKGISYVKQQPFFINDSVLKNIILSDDDYHVQRLQHAISFAGINPMLDSYKDGIHQIITENGKNISGGQRQRMMLARAIYHGFDLLILDEPFSEMDEPSEKEMLIRLGLLAREGKMIIMITHNKNSLSYCNKLISL